MENRVNKRIAACVVTYNRKEKLLNCIKSLQNQSYQDFDILVIDNASTDGTQNALQTYIDNKSITYQNTGSNLGGAGGFNYAMKLAAPLYDYLWIMDDDTYPKQNALQGLLDGAGTLDNKFGFLSSLTEWSDGTSCLMNRQKISSDIHRDITALECKLIPIENASFVSLFIKSDIVKKYGLPIKEFFLWGDDTEFTERIAKEKGYLCLDSVVVHDMASNDGVDIVHNDINRVARYYMFIRNRVYIAKEHGNKIEIAKAYLSALKQTLRILAKSDDHKMERIKIISKGIKESFGFNPKVEYIKTNSDRLLVK